MGCDIHLVLERKEEGSEWVGVYCTDFMPIGHVLRRRDYGLFAELAHVRGSTDTGLYPRNLPRDVSRLAWLQYMQAPTDHHSPSHLSLEEFADAYFRANPEIEVNGERAREKPRRAHAAYDLFTIDTSYPENTEYRVVFWFDN